MYAVFMMLFAPSVGLEILVGIMHLLWGRGYEENYLEMAHPSSGLLAIVCVGECGGGLLCGGWCEGARHVTIRNIYERKFLIVRLNESIAVYF